MAARSSPRPFLVTTSLAGLHVQLSHKPVFGRQTPPPVVGRALGRLRRPGTADCTASGIQCLPATALAPGIRVPTCSEQHQDFRTLNNPLHHPHAQRNHCRHRGSYTFCCLLITAPGLAALRADRPGSAEGNRLCPMWACTPLRIHRRTPASRAAAPQTDSRFRPQTAHCGQEHPRCGNAR
jgi:hypothetical protein